MVMSKQPDGMRRVKRSEGPDGKTSEYTIFLTHAGGEIEVGYSRRVVKGSVSKWEGYARTGESAYAVFPEAYKDHNALMTDLRGKWLEAHPPEAAGSSTAVEPGTAESPAEPSTAGASAASAGSAKPKRQRKPRAKADPGPGEVPTTATEASGETVPSPGTAEEEPQAGAPAAPAETGFGGVASPPPADSVPAVMAAGEAPAAPAAEVVFLPEEAFVQPATGVVPVPVFQHAPDMGLDPLADPLRDPLSPAFMSPG